MVKWPRDPKRKTTKASRCHQADMATLQTMLGELADHEECHIVSSSSASSSVAGPASSMNICPKVEPPVDDAPTVDAEHGLVETSDNMPAMADDVLNADYGIEGGTDGIDNMPAMAEDDVLNADDVIEGGTDGIDGIDDDGECTPGQPLSNSKSAKRHRRKRLLQNAHRFAGTEDDLHISVSARRKRNRVEL